MGEPVFRGYDRDALDREYNNRAKVADSAAWLARYTRESEAARGALACRLDVPYGPRPAETLDLFPASGPGPAPVQVFVHGGYWRSLDKSDFSYVAEAFQPAGVAVAIINYALCHGEITRIIRERPELGSDGWRGGQSRAASRGTPHRAGVASRRGLP